MVHTEKSNSTHTQNFEPLIPDWIAALENECTFNSEEDNKAKSAYSEYIPHLATFDVVQGTIVSLNKKEALVNIGYKSDGLIPMRELRGLKNLELGSKIDVYVVSSEDKNGKLLISYEKALLLKSWKKINNSHDTKEPVESVVKHPTKGGLVVDIDGIECFLPITQIDYRPVTDLDSYVGRAIDVIVLKINKLNNNVVVSHKAIIEQGVEVQKASILGSLEKGAILEGIVKNIANFGVFVDLGGLDGLLHITDICWKRISHPTDVLDMGQKVNVLVLDFDEEKKRVSLGMKQLVPHPWETLPDDYAVGKIVKSKVVCIADYGIFVEVIPGVEGLIHASELAWSYPPDNPKKAFSLGDEVEAKIILLDRESRKLALSVKQMSENPWSQGNLMEKYPIGSVQKGKIKNIAKFGVFVELEQGVDGLLHISDLSWTNKVEHPSEILKSGDEIEVKVLAVNVEEKKLALGVKQLSPNPYEQFKDQLQPGCLVKGVLLKFTKFSKGAVIKLDQGIEVFARKETLLKDDNTEIKLGEFAEYRVLSFDQENCNIVVSHTAVANPAEVEENKLRKNFFNSSSENQSEKSE